MATQTIPCIYVIEESEKNSAYVRGAIVDTDYTCDVHPFISGNDAIEELSQAEAAKPDMILLSLTLEDINGLELLKKLKTDEKLRGIPVIVLGDAKNKELVNEAYQNYANSFINKVTTVGDYLNVVKNLKNLWLKRITA